MNLWSDIMVDLIENIKSNPIVYYIGLLIGLALLSLIIYLIVKNDRKKKERQKEANEEKARIEKHVDLESMIAKMQEQEQNKLKDVDPVANFEQEQEEKAIISYQELVNAVKTDTKEPINVINVSSTGDVLSTTNVPRIEADDKPIFIDEIKLPKTEIEFDPAEENFVTKDESVQKIDNVIPVVDEDIYSVKQEKNIPDEYFEMTTPKDNHDIWRREEIDSVNTVSAIKEIAEQQPVKQPSSKFKNSEFISPIYGRQNSNISYPKISSFKTEEDSEEDDIINISSDVDPNDEFLKTLRAFRNN